MASTTNSLPNMSPSQGVVVDTNGGLLGVRLATRALVHVAKQKGLRLGDRCYILYDYTRMRVREVWTEAEYNDSGHEPQLDWDDIEEPEILSANELAVQSLGLSVVSL